MRSNAEDFSGDNGRLFQIEPVDVRFHAGKLAGAWGRALAGPLLDMVKLEDVSADYVATLPSPVPADLELFASLGFTGPDGIAFGKSGKLYVAQALSSDEDVTFLNHGSFGACPRPVLEAAARARGVPRRAR